jgi:hypothetical protein
MTDTAQKSDSVAELLRGAGPRAEAPADRACRVRSAVHAEWQTVVHQRTGRRRATWLVTGGLACAAIVIVIVQALSGPADGEIARAKPDPAPAMESHVITVAEPGHQHEGARFRATDEERAPDGGLPRRVLANYSWESR